MSPAPASAPIVEVLTSREVAGAVGVLVLALLGLAVAAARWARAWVEGRLGALHTQIEGAAAAAEVAAEQAGAAREGVTNAHGTHLRDDLDEVRATLATVLARMDMAETARQADVERQAETLGLIAQRVSRVETHADGLRADLRALDARVTHQEDRPCQTGRPC